MEYTISGYHDRSSADTYVNVWAITKAGEGVLLVGHSFAFFFFQFVMSFESEGKVILSDVRTAGVKGFLMTDER